jgi:hypothetical protein
MVINFSQDLRDQMNCAGYDEGFWRINRACLAERNISAGWENYDDVEGLAMGHEGETKLK